MSWLSADAGKSKQIVAVPIFYASPEPCLLNGLLDHRFMHDNSVCPYFQLRVKSPAQPLGKFLEFRNISGDDAECTRGAVVIGRPAVPNLQTLVTTLKTVCGVVLAIVRPLGLIDFHSL
jgi:hypothetical protein